MSKWFKETKTPGWDGQTVTGYAPVHHLCPELAGEECLGLDCVRPCDWANDQFCWTSPFCPLDLAPTDHPIQDLECGQCPLQDNCPHGQKGGDNE